MFMVATLRRSQHIVANPTEKSRRGNMIREFEYKGEIFRTNYHGAPGHEEVFIMHMIDGEEFGEMSIDRMTEENDTDAPIEQICIDLCEKLIPEREIQVADPSAGFKWRDVKPLFGVHDGKQETTMKEKTGLPCTVTGIYLAHHDKEHKQPHEVKMVKGHKFPICNQCENGGPTYELVKEDPNLIR